MWLRYLDEIFCIWTKGSQDLNELFNCINSLRPTIKFTMDYSTTEINFLAVNVRKVCNKLETDIYCKPNDTHQHLQVQSCYRTVYKIFIAWGQVLRFKRICSIEEKLNNRLEHLIQLLVKRGYKEHHVNSEIERVKLVKVDDSITLVLTYHPALNQFYEVLLRPHKHVLKSPRLYGALPSQTRVAS